MNIFDGGKIKMFAPDEGCKDQNSAPATRSPAAARALMKAARSPVLAEVLVIVLGRAIETATGVDPGSGRKRRSVRKT